MKKKLIVMGSLVLMSVMVISLVSANWFTDIFNRGPPSIDSKGVSYSPAEFTLKDLAEGVQLKSGWNYWYIWADKDVSVKDIVSGLDSKSYYYLYEYNPRNRTYLYWYNKAFYPNGKDGFDKFTKGNQYAIYMRVPAMWKYSESLVIEHDIGVLKLYSSMTRKEYCELDDFKGVDAYFQKCLIGASAKYLSPTGTNIDVLVEEYSSVASDASYGLLNYILREENEGKQDRYKGYTSSIKSWKNNSYYVVFSEDTGEGIVAWQSGNKLVVFGLSLKGNEEPEDIFTAYIEKYPSDLNANSPVPAIPTSSSGGSSGGGGGSSNSSSSAVTYQGVLEMLQNNCNILNPNGEANLGNLTTGRKTCENYNREYSKNTFCVLADAVKGSDQSLITEVLSCNLDIDNTRWAHVLCCSAP